MIIRDLIMLALILIVFMIVMWFNNCVININLPIYKKELNLINTESIYHHAIDTIKNIKFDIDNLEIESSVNAVDITKQTIYDVKLDYDLQSYIYELCNEYQLSYSLVISIIWRESMFDSTAYNNNCKGLMQINEPIHKNRMKRLGVNNLYNPYQNVLVGIDYLSQLFNTYGNDIHFVLMVYNGGESYAKRLYKNGFYSTQYSRWIVNKTNECLNVYGY